MKFSELKENGSCSEALMDVVEEEFGFEEMTPVQQAVINRFINGQDVAVEACTGSGKTLAFLIPAIEMMIRNVKKENSATGKFAGIGALVIVPTRELAQQIHAVSAKIVSGLAKKSIHLGSVAITGGKSVQKDREILFSPTSNVVVATPGRIMDLVTRFPSQFKTNISNFQVLVLDEADVLLDAGFKDAFEKILIHIPKQRRTGLFSATQTSEVKSLIRAGLRNPSVISVQLQSDQTRDSDAQKKTNFVPEKLANFYFHCEEDEKLERLISFIEQEKADKMIVFFSTCACVEFFTLIFKHLIETKKIEIDLNLFSLHGKMPQKKREKNTKNFASTKNSLLFCTDVAARGVDFPDVEWIIQYHAPQDPSFFIHRVGRTARAGKSGKALLFLLPKEDTYVHFIKNRGVALTELPFTSGNKLDVLSIVREEQMQNRLFLEAGTKAFISFLRSYKEHKLGFVFRLQDLDLFKIASAFVLFQIPKLSELRLSKGIENYPVVSPEIVKNIKFKDEAKETQRMQKYEALKQERQNPQKQPHKKARKNQSKPVMAEEEKSSKDKRKKKGKRQRILEEWDDLAKEENLFKKLRKKKISKAEFDEKLMNFN